MSDRDAAFASERDQAVAQSDAAVAALHRTFLATPYRPTSLSTAARAIVRLVDELNWLNAIVVAAVAPSERAPADHAACAVEVAAAAVLERGADLLTLMGGDCTELHAALAELSGALGQTGGRRDGVPAGRASRWRPPAGRPLAQASASSSPRSTPAFARRSWASRSRGSPRTSI